MNSSRTCAELPTVIGSCPTRAISPDPANKSVKINAEKCMYCGNCFTVCPPISIKDPERDGVAIVVGGKINSLRTNPKFSKLVIPYISNEPPRWPKVVAAIKHIVEVYAKNAKKHERIGEWIERIGMGEVLLAGQYRLYIPVYRRLHLHERYNEDSINI